jgi:hypothetical protein
MTVKVSKHIIFLITYALMLSIMLSCCSPYPVPV